ncbi:FadR/GntR family transcriptional regulator [Cellulomonas pakistanensis]|uniref:GntR family transcriptional regulator n=1 Tax=Cellulomonas pakistanensis TaxID=992287 RepID=A0A919U4Y7_9CELL|nr:FadR/GntR family transcriptional regulator [Cellulomonas pakistanensis]GIG35544.1 GntR family transcriptional regulator [Cellulomonas pakistanensis]
MSGARTRSVVDAVRARILDGSLPPGARLPSEAELVAAHGVSRTVVREAVTRLRAEGLVETAQGRGSFVLAVPEPTPFGVEAATVRSHADVLAMLDFRIGVESEAAYLAAAHRTGPDASAVEAALAAFAAARPNRAVEADFAFHRAVAAATGNRFYRDLVDALGPMMILLPRTRLQDRYSLVDEAHVHRVHDEHAAVAEAVVAGDPETARAAMRVHLGGTRRRLRA